MASMGSATTETNSNSSADTFECFSCGIFQTYNETSTDFITRLSEALIDPTTALFLALVFLWSVIQGYNLIFDKTNAHTLFQDLFFMGVSGALLSSTSRPFVLSVFDAAYQTMGAVAAIPITIFIDHFGIKPPGNYQGMELFVAVSEQGLLAILRVAELISKTATLTNWMPVLYALLYVIPFILMSVMFFAKNVVGIFRITTIAGFSPFLCLCLGFSWGRDAFKSGMKTLFASILILFASSLALGVILAGVTALDLETLSQEDLQSVVSITNPKFMTAILLGYAGLAFMTEANGIANSVFGTMLTNNAAAIITGGITGTAAAVASKAMPLTSYGAKAAVKTLGVGGHALSNPGEVKGQAKEAVSEKARDLLDRYTNIRKPKA